MDVVNLDKYSVIFKALGDDTRLKIVRLLSKDEYCVGGLAKHFKMTDSAISQHLKVLKEANLVVGKKVGYYTHYMVNKEGLKLISSFLKMWI